MGSTWQMDDSALKCFKCWSSIAWYVDLLRRDSSETSRMEWVGWSTHCEWITSRCLKYLSRYFFIHYNLVYRDTKEIAQKDIITMESPWSSFIRETHSLPTSYARLLSRLLHHNESFIKKNFFFLLLHSSFLRFLSLRRAPPRSFFFIPHCLHCFIVLVMFQRECVRGWMGSTEYMIRKKYCISSFPLRHPSRSFRSRKEKFKGNILVSKYKLRIKDGEGFVCK